MALFDGTEVLVPGDFNPIRNAAGDWELRRAGVAIGRMPADGFYFDRLEKYPGALHPDLYSWSVPRLSDSELEHYARAAEELYPNTDKAIIAALGPPYELFNGIGQGGFEDWMITFASEPDYVADLYQLLTDAWIENLELFHHAVGDRLQILQICDDFGTQRAPFLSVPMFRERLLPAYQRGLDWIHAHTPWKVMLHSDGALYPLLPSIIEMGVDILNPVQTSAAGMDAPRLKDEFGTRLVFWGGSCDPQTTLRSALPTRSPPRPATSRSSPRWRLRLRAGPQHPGECSAREHSGPDQNGPAPTNFSIGMIRCCIGGTPGSGPAAAHPPPQIGPKPSDAARPDVRRTRVSVPNHGPAFGRRCPSCRRHGKWPGALHRR